MSVSTRQRLASLLHPRSVVLIGATDRSGFSRVAYANLVEAGHAEHIHLVNRRGSSAHGRVTVTSCTQIREPVDLAFAMVPQAAIPAALADAAAAGIRNVLVLSSGFADAGEAGRQAQDELVTLAESLGMLVLGPNHLGFANLVDQIPVTAIPGLPHAGGPVALVSQSGMGASAMLDFAAMTGVGLSYVVTLGNEAMVTAGDVLDYLVDDEHTKAVALLLETVRHPADFAPTTRRALAGLLPPFATAQNPLDITGAAIIDPGLFAAAIEIMSGDPAAGVVAVISALPWQPVSEPWLGQSLADAIGAGAQRARVPVVQVTQALQPVTGYTRQVMAAAGIPYVLPGLQHATQALANLARWSHALERRRFP